MKTTSKAPSSIIKFESGNDLRGSYLYKQKFSINQNKKITNDCGSS
jgi:hypothetical protein